MAADMPSETELLTTAKHLLTAACSSRWLLPSARKTPAFLAKEKRGSRVWVGVGLDPTAWITGASREAHRSVNEAELR